MYDRILSSPCSGLVVSSFSKGTFKDYIWNTYFAKAMEPLKSFKKTYIIDKTTEEFKGLMEYSFSKHKLWYFEDFESELKLRYVRIFFSATTFDRIEKDRAAKFVDMLSTIGGTMGLLTGFSIISGMEIIYFGIKIILKILKKRIRMKSTTHKT